MQNLKNLASKILPLLIKYLTTKGLVEIRLYFIKNFKSKHFVTFRVILNATAIKSTIALGALAMNEN